MHSVGWVVAWLVGCALGLALLGGRPGGLDPRFGWALMALALLLLAPAVLARNDRRTMWAALLAMALLFGLGRALITHPPVTPSDLAYYNAPAKAKTVVVIGTIETEPVFTDRSQRLRVAVEQVQLPGELVERPVAGSLLAIVPRYPEYAYGDVVSLSGALTVPPQVSGFDYPAYLARQGVYSYMSFPKVTPLDPPNLSWPAQLVDGARTSARASLRSNMPEPQAALAVGVVMGDRSALPEGVKEAFNHSGTAHVLAISGQNIALLVGFITLLYTHGRTRKRMPIWLTGLVLLLLVGYTAFTGGAAPVVRASVMAGVLLFAAPVGRRYDATAALAVSAFGMTLLDPDALADTGFQLSFATMLGIVLLSPHIAGGLRRLRVPNMLALALAASLGAQIAVLPLLAMLTGSISLVSPLATLAVDPALLPLMIFGLLSGFAGAIFPLAGWVFALPASWCGSWMVWWAEFWSSLPFASIAFDSFHPAWALAYFGALGFWLWAAGLRTNTPGAFTAVAQRGAGLRALLGLALALWIVLLGVAIAG